MSISGQANPTVSIPTAKTVSWQKSIANSFTRLDWVIVAGIVIVALGARALPGPRTIDDAFITFRYSRNIVEGNGFVYNLGLHSLGTTTPLFTLLMAAISAVLHAQDFPNYAIVVDALADAGTCIILFWLGRRILGNRWPGALIAILWALAPISVTFVVGGMETSLEIFWTVAAIGLFISDRPNLMAVCIALGFLTRVDGLAWIGPLLLFDLYQRVRQHRELPWRTWLVALIVAAPWLIFSTVYFGSPLSDTIAAKLQVYHLPAGTAAFSLLTWYATPFQEFDAFGSAGPWIGIVAYSALCIVGSLILIRHEARLLPWLIYPWLYSALFVIINPLIFRWYMPPFILPYIFAIVGGAWVLLQGKVRTLKSTRPSRIGAVVFAVLGLLWIGLSINGWELHPVDPPSDRPAPRMAYHGLESAYLELVNNLHAKFSLTAQTRVAISDVGVFGYYSNTTILDTIGLVTPNLLRYYPYDPAILVNGENYAVPVAMILDQQPDYLVTVDTFIENGLQKNATFQAEYHLIAHVPLTVYGRDLQVYQKQVTTEAF